MLLVEHHDGVGNDTNHDRRHAVEHIGSEANHIAQAIAAILRQVDAGPDAQGHPQNTGQSENECRSDDRIGHSPAGFAHRLRRLRQKSPVDRSDSAIDQIGEDCEQRHQHQNDRQHGHSRHEVVSETAPQRNRGNDLTRRGFFRLRHWPSKAGRESPSRPASAPARSPRS